MIPTSRPVLALYRKWLAIVVSLLGVSTTLSAQTNEFRAVWVDAWGTGFLNGTQVNNLVNHCRTYNFNAVIVQMRRRGDAFYMPQAPNLEPRTTALASGFDALQDLITRCNTGSPKIEVHCWIPTHLVGDAASPGVANHVMNVHPEYLMKNSSGATHIGEGYYLDPGHPGAQQWNYNVAMDIVSRYNIDGFHWDYIRYPVADSGYNDTAISRYNAEFGTSGLPASGDIQFSNWRRRQVTDFLRWVNADLLAIKPNLIISASVFASRSDAFNARFQDWASWNNEGLLDICFPMNYTADNSVFNSRVNDAIANQGVRRVYVGPGAYLNTKENTVTQLQYVRSQGLLGTSLYSYRTPNSGTVDQTGTFSYVKANYQPTWVNTPTLPWKTSPTKGIVKGKVTRQDTGAPVYNATVSINTTPGRTIKTDAHGSYAFYETLPGTYTVTASGVGLGNVSGSTTVSAGLVVTRNLVFPSDSVPPVISNVSVSSITDSSAIVSWSTDEISSSVVEYGTTISYGSSVSNTNPVMNRSLSLTGLNPATTYHFRVRSTDANTNEAVSADFTFVTNPSGVVNDLIVESRVAGGALNSTNFYRDAKFGDSTLKSSAPGLSGTGSRYATTNTATFTVTPTLAIASATYDVYLTHGVATSISDDLVVSVSGSGFTGLPSTTTIFRESGGNTWELLGRMKLNGGVTKPTLTFAPASGTMNASSRMYSDAIKFVYVPTAPVFDTQPQSQSVNFGSTAVFAVQASGTAPLSYQWKKGGVNLSNGGRVSGANTPTLSIASVDAGDAGNYSVTVSNGIGSTNSVIATLTVLEPIIVEQPVHTTNTLGTSASFSVSAIGTPVLSYQWRQNGVPLSESPKFTGTSTPNLTINALTLADAAGYSVVVANGFGSVTSVVANLVVSASPVISVEPQSQTVAAGTPVSFSVQADGAAPMTFRWQKNQVDLNNGGNVSGADTGTLQLSTTSLIDEAGYQVIVSNTFGSMTSQIATLTVISPPVITAQPTTQTNRGGSTATFTVAVSGTAPFSYQWFRNGAALVNGANVSGALSPTLSVANVTQADAAVYQVIISNTAGSATSGTASLVVRDGDVVVFHDDFEGGSMANWTQTTGTAGTSLVNDGTQNADPVSGFRSAKMDNSLDRMHRNIIADNGGSEVAGGARVSFFVYDGVATRAYNEVRGYSGGTGLPNGGTAANGSLAQLLAAGKYNSTTLASDPYDATKYQGRVLTGATSGWFNLNGPGAPSRSPGWHKFEIERQPDGTTIHFYVDGILSRVITGAAAHDWDTLVLGPGIGTSPGTAGDSWIDGFKVEKLGTVPVFTQSPQNTSISVGQTLTLNAIATGKGPISYQWKKGTTSLVNDSRITGANALTLTITDVELSDAGSYTVVASNADGTATSGAAVVSINDIAPAIVQHPASATNNAGSTAGFTVQASGTSLEYQWLKNGVELVDGGEISGSQTATLVINDVRQSDAAAYSVRVSNSADTVESDPATLTVIDPPVITLQPVGLTANAGQTVSFTTAASGVGVTYQWRKNGNNLVSGGNVSGATSATLTLVNVLGADAGSYTVVASNPAGSETSETAVLLVNDPIIVSGPEDRQVALGGTATFSVAAFGTEELSYQWKKDGVDLSNGPKISGATSASLTLTDIQNADLGEYTVTVTSEGGGSVTSDPASLGLITAPQITAQPIGGTFNVDGTFTLSVAATGGALSYQWTRNGTNLVNGGRISGATSSTLTVSGLVPGDAGIYRVNVSNAGGSVLSDPAAIVINNDTKIPTIKLTFPGSNFRLLENVHITNYVTRIYGTAADDIAVDRVMYSLNGAPFVNADGTNNWDAIVTLIPGTNSIVVRSYDTAGRVSLDLSRKFVYVVTSPLTAVVKGGPGFILNNLHGQMLEVGRNYKLTAGITGTNFIFTNWTQIVAGQTNHSSANPLTFMMQSNLVLEANFIPNPFLGAAGLYNGLFYEAGGVEHESAGFITLKVTPKMTYSGKLQIDGSAISLSGKFDLDGNGTKELVRHKLGKTNLTVALAIDLAGPLDAITGTVTCGTNWTSSFSADRYLWSSNNVPVSYTNNYTMAIPGFADASEGPAGHGYGLLTVSSLGRVRFTGSGADGHVFSQSSYLSKDGELPLYVPLYGLYKTNYPNGVMYRFREFQGSIMGWITFATNAPAGRTNLAPQGLLKWTKKGWTNAVYADGFTNAVNVLGSRHLAPAKGVRVLNLTNAEVAFAEGNLTAPLQSDFFMTTNSVFTPLAPHNNMIKPSVTLRTGLLRGTFSHPGNTNVLTRFFGVVLQDYNYGRGYFVGQTEGGAVTLDSK